LQLVFVVHDLRQQLHLLLVFRQPNVHGNAGYVQHTFVQCVQRREPRLLLVFIGQSNLHGNASGLQHVQFVHHVWRKQQLYMVNQPHV
jgi:hypothetical protein